MAEKLPLPREMLLQDMVSLLMSSTTCCSDCSSAAEGKAAGMDLESCFLLFFFDTDREDTDRDDTDRDDFIFFMKPILLTIVVVVLFLFTLAMYLSNVFVAGRRH